MNEISRESRLRFNRENRDDSQAPRLVETRRGASVLYRERYLYSKYNPEEAIDRIVACTEIKNQTLIICTSPLLGYGLEKLSEKTPSDSFILLTEGNPDLYEFSLNYISALHLPEEKTEYIFLKKGNDILKWLESKGENFILNFRRVVRLDFSGGSFFSKDKYSVAEKLLTQSINLSWKNKMTLIKFGRLYSKNIILNLSLLPEAKVFPEITKPVIALGAGESLENTAGFLRTARNDFFVAAVDAALIPLLDLNICPDCVVVLESQIYNNESFIGIKKRIHDKEFEMPFFICDLTSRYSLNREFTENIGFILSDFSRCNFLEIIKALGIPVIPPLGSVGLALLKIISLLNKNSQPIFFSGLDFSYKPGKTHSRGTHQIMNDIHTAFRLQPPGSRKTFFSPEIFKVWGINKKRVLCDPSLNMYGEIMNTIFKDEFFYDLRTSGIPLDFPRTDIRNINSFISGIKTLHRKDTLFIRGNYNPKKILNFLENELVYLENLCRELTGEKQTGSTVPSRDLKNHEYLFLHFPDILGATDPGISFYKRLKIEAIYFSKIIRTSILILRKSF